jgi:hypothetical protein
VRLDHSVDISAAPSAVWAALTDVTAWPKFVPSVSAVEPLDEGPLEVGARYKLGQPKLPVNIWTVTELVEGHSFVWETRSPGLRVAAFHEITATPGGSTLRLAVDQTGFLALTMGLFTRSMTRRYLAMEAEAMKKRAESA